MKVGYARVSTADQSLSNQIDALKEFGCEKIFQEKQSGKDANSREQFQLALDFVREGDILVVTKLDRMARSVLDLNLIAKRLQDKSAERPCTESSMRPELYFLELAITRSLGASFSPWPLGDAVKLPDSAMK